MMLWVDKHVPRRIGEAHPMLCKRLYLRCDLLCLCLCSCAGDMVGSAEVSRKLADWLRRWPEMHAHGSGDKAKKAAQAGKDNPGAKVCGGVAHSLHCVQCANASPHPAPPHPLPPTLPCRPPCCPGRRA